MPVQNHLIFHH